MLRHSLSLNRLLLIILPLFIILPTVPTHAAKLKINYSIRDAYYTCLDNDSKEDDVVGIIHVHISNPKTVSNFKIVATLILPSGNGFVGEIRLVTSKSTFFLDIEFRNCALESGDYYLQVVLTLYTGGTQTLTDDIVFDPPTGDDPSPPTLTCRLY